MSGTKKISGKIMCCIIVVAILISGMCTALMHAHFLGLYYDESNATIEATIEIADVDIAFVDMVSSNAMGIYNSTYIQQILYQNTNIKKVSEFLYHTVDFCDRGNRYFDAFMNRYPVDESMLFTQTKVLKFIHNMDGKKRI